MDNKAVIVTGAGRGIGLAIAEKLAATGYHLALVEVNEDSLQSAASQIKGDVTVKTYPGDITNWEKVQAITEGVKQDFGAIWGLVNNAGVTKDNLFVRMKPDDWQYVMDVNLNGTFYFTRAVAPIMMRQREGRIINISSVIGLTGNAGQANYAASKAGVIALTKSVARELGSRSVTVNVVAPGFITTDMTSGLSEQVKADMLQQIPLKRFGDAKDVAALVSFLLSTDAAYITGQTVVCDGGMVL
jgi:3-oxoacyl-[acyl-carrier protein] reductase